jgi:myo-inositol-1(or 4)-monophosphatase
LSGTAEAELVWVPKAAAIAREAGARLREFFAQGVETEYKGDVDLVTVADRTAEKLIRERLARRFPSTASMAKRARGSAWRASSAGMWIRWTGRRILRMDFRSFAFRWGWSSEIWDRRLFRMGRLWPASSTIPCATSLYVAERGSGAWLNGKPIHVSRIETLAESLVSTGFPSRKRHDSPNIHFYHEFTLRSHGVRRAGSAALDLAYVAAVAWKLFGSST